MEEKIRSFIAIEINNAFAQELKRIQEHLKNSLDGKINWVEPKNIHLTLRFLDNITPAQTEQIKQIIIKIARKNKEFSINPGILSAFPSILNPQILWVGIASGCKQLRDIAKTLQDELAKINFSPDEKPFHPHLTLGRIKFTKDKKAFGKMSKEIVVNSSLVSRVNRIVLFKSTLTPQGAIYSPIHTVEF
ncbi:MAG: RNA 2',3'-cyclic phosphodiesterase [Candidatus Omnitrophota bacterium]